MIMNDIQFMQRAIALAKEAGKRGEIPVGAVVVKNGEIIGEGMNTREGKNTVSGHAEIQALENASLKSGDWRLSGCTLYVTLEPCPMCASAIEQSRISRLVYGSADERMGAAGGKIDMFKYDFSLPVSITPFVLKEECDEILNNFFTVKRNKERM